MSLERATQGKYITWEELVEEHEREVAFQDKYFLIPTFRAKDLVEETMPILRRGQDLISKEGAIPGIRTNISQMEIIYPFLLEKAGLLKEEPPEWAVTESLNKAAIVGQQMHKADAIFSVALHGIRGPLLKSYLPSFEDEDVGRIDHALRYINIPKDADEEEVATQLKIAWSRYKSIYVEEEVVNLAFPGFGMVDPRKKRKFEKSLEIDRAVNDLAEVWAKEIVSPRPITWEFERPDGEEIVNQREVLSPIKFMGPNIQLIARFDSVARRRPTTDLDAEKKKATGKVRSQHIDFKTGTSEASSSLDAEIKRRQAQVMRVMIEKFTVRYLTDFKSLRKTDGAFAMRAKHDTKKGMDRVALSGNRYVDLEEKTMRLETFDFKDDAEREDFNIWFAWYGSMIHYFKSDIRALIKRKPKYRLSGAELSGRFSERLYLGN